MKISLIGTRGVPARYGGFETAVEEIGQRLAARGHNITVFCRTNSSERVDSQRLPQAPRLRKYQGMTLVHLPTIPRRSLETLSHTALSVLHPSLRGSDAAIVFNAANSIFLPVLRARGIPAATHVDGLEWQRAKWGLLGRAYYRAAESLAVRWSDRLIADAQGIADYYADEFGAGTSLLSYGAPIKDLTTAERVEELELSPGKYHLVVARFEPENHVLEIVQGYSRSGAELPLVVVGSAPYADRYIARIREAAGPQVRLLGAVWDQEQLDQLYAGALTYLHGHSVGGTNPSLLRAAGSGTYSIAYDVGFNSEILGDTAGYFSTPAEVARELLLAEADPAYANDQGVRLRELIRRYDWDDVTDGYEDLCRSLADGEFAGARPSGRRRQQRELAVPGPSRRRQRVAR